MWIRLGRYKCVNPLSGQIWIISIFVQKKLLIWNSYHAKIPVIDISLIVFAWFKNAFCDNLMLLSCQFLVQSKMSKTLRKWDNIFLRKVLAHLFSFHSFPGFTCVGKLGAKPDGTTIKYTDPNSKHHWYECLGGVAKKYGCTPSHLVFSEPVQYCV